jgi:hypothetical protein
MKAKFGAIIVAGSGKIGGHVASHNRHGAYLRTKVTPVNPQSSYQSTVRNRFSGISSGWRGLTQAQRDAWNSAVVDFQKTNIFGDLKTPSGFNLYQRINNVLLLIGKAAVTTPPNVTAVDSLLTLSAVGSVVMASIDITYTPAIAADHSALCYMTAPQSAGKSFVKSEYRLVKVMLTADTSPYDIAAAYIARFGALPAIGQKVFIRIVEVEWTSGLQGSARTTSFVMAT